MLRSVRSPSVAIVAPCLWRSIGVAAVLPTMTTPSPEGTHGEVWNRITLLGYDLMALNQQMIAINDEIGDHGDNVNLRQCRQQINESVCDSVDVLGELCGLEPDPNDWIPRWRGRQS